MRVDVHKDLKKMLKKGYKGYVLITCRPQTEDGHMEVEMSYDGDPVLASFLMEGAQEYLYDASQLP